MRQVTLFYRMMMASLLLSHAKDYLQPAAKPARLPSGVKRAIKVFEYEGWQYLNRFTIDYHSESSETVAPARPDLFELLMRSPTNFNYLLIVQPDGSIKDVLPV
jgi:hypothetical protein